MAYFIDDVIVAIVLKGIATPQNALMAYDHGLA